MIPCEYFWRDLGISPEEVSRRGLRVFPEAAALTVVHGPGRDFQMTPETAAAWRRLRTASARDGVGITLVSAFRSYAYQAELIRKKLALGKRLEDVLTVLAPPGCSEHHTGAALDLGTPGCPPADESFEQTAAFDWLKRAAHSHGFSMSYPRDNHQGYIYEPWHWRFEGRLIG
ncbi:MAG: M15 family metallopeptidase [Lentisphaeria bacterium]|nr:M15 family metallopeptidase [Lentisphaeria bacterium]